MRPLRKPPRPHADFSLNAQAVLLDQLGPYCACCERPLPEGAVVWDRRGKAMSSTATIDRDDWPFVLHLCRNCAACLTRESPPQAMLLPDRDDTFHLSQASPFVYERVPVQVRLNRGRERAISMVEELVVVRGDAAAAAETVTAFALNTLWYDDANRVLEVDQHDHDALIDDRMFARTRAWTFAEQTVGLSLETREHHGWPEVAIGIRAAVAATGFWSVWATVAWERTQDPAFVREILQPDDSDWLWDPDTGLSVERVGRSRSVVRGAGLHNPFPATARTWW